MIEGFREFTFEAAHRLEPHAGLHGHSFTVTIYFRGAPDPVFGWVASLPEIDCHTETVRRALDEKFLNDVEGLAVPSIENIAAWIWQRLQPVIPGLDRVAVRRGAQGNGAGCVFAGRHLPALAAAE